MLPTFSPTFLPSNSPTSQPTQPTVAPSIVRYGIWSELSINALDPPRYGHTSVLVHGAVTVIYTFGGFNSVALSDVWSFDTAHSMFIVYNF